MPHAVSCGLGHREAAGESQLSLTAPSYDSHQDEELMDVRARALAAEQQLSALKVAHMAVETAMHALQLCAAPREP